MQFELNRLLSKLTEKLVRDSQEDMELKSELRALAACLLEVTKGGPPIRGSSIPRPETRESEVTPPPPRPREFTRDESDLPSPGGRTPGRSGSMPITDEDLPMIETRCRLKRESLLWSIDRQGLLAKRADYQTEISPVDRELIRRAKELPDCYLWMLSSQWRPPENTRLLEDLAECFENMATATSLARRLLADEGRDRIVFEQALDLLAEAQSAVRMGVSQVNDYWDFDQNAVFRWLRGVAAREHILIKRHMRLDDPADPSRWADLQSRIGGLESESLNSEERNQERARLFVKLHGHVTEIKNLENEDEGDEQWREVAECVESLLKLGVSPTSRELYNLFEGVLDSAPIIEDHPGFERVLEEIERRSDAGGFTEEEAAGTGTDSEAEDGADDDLDDDLSSDDDDDEEEPEDEVAPPARTTRRAAAATTTTRRRAAAVEPESEDDDEADFGDADEESAADDESWPEPDVLEVRKLLKGRRVVFAGGERRADVAEALIEGFGLKELTWVAMRDDESLDRLEEELDEIDPALVLVGVRGVSVPLKSVQRLCTVAQKPMIKLPTGYSPAHVASQILSQAGDELRDE
jgi:hypothetical protein